MVAGNLVGSRLADKSLMGTIAGLLLWDALVMDLGLVVFFLVYTFVFNWAFDAIFGLPASAAGAAQPA